MRQCLNTLKNASACHVLSVYTFDMKDFRYGVCEYRQCTASVYIYMYGLPDDDDIYDLLCSSLDECSVRLKKGWFFFVLNAHDICIRGSSKSESTETYNGGRQRIRARELHDCASAWSSSVADESKIRGEVQDRLSLSACSAPPASSTHAGCAKCTPEVQCARQMCRTNTWRAAYASGRSKAPVAVSLCVFG